jgi:Fe-S oxidoreductase
LLQWFRAILVWFPRPSVVSSAFPRPFSHPPVVIVKKPLQDGDARLGLDVDRPPQGCCGMAGAFGFASETYEVSQLIGERVLLPAVREAASDTLILADGFSCREQIEQGSGRGTMHLADLLAERMLASP